MPINSPRSMAIGELSRRSGVNIETIRYYERSGIMPRPVRTEGGQRRYEQADARRLAFIRRGRELGMSLGQVGQLLRLVDREETTCARVKEITAGHLEDVRSKLADLARVESVLIKMLAACSGGVVPECPVIDVLAGEDSLLVSRA